MKELKLTKQFYIDREVNNYPYILLCKPADDEVGGVISCPFTEADDVSYAISRMRPFYELYDVPRFDSYDPDWYWEGLGCIRHSFLGRFGEQFYLEKERLEEERFKTLNGYYSDRHQLELVLAKIMGFFSSVLIQYDGGERTAKDTKTFRVRLTKPERIPISDLKFNGCNGWLPFIPLVKKSRSNSVHNPDRVMPLFRSKYMGEDTVTDIREYERRGNTCYVPKGYKSADADGNKDGSNDCKSICGYAPFFFTAVNKSKTTLFYASGEPEIYPVYSSATWDEVRFTAAARKFLTLCFGQYAADPEKWNPMRHYFESEKLLATSLITAKVTPDDVAECLDYFMDNLNDIVTFWVSKDSHYSDVTDKFWDWFHQHIEPLVRLVYGEIRTKYFTRFRID